jgi:multidrug efflux pump subunit AcrA (membrane-fusion protein)
MTGMAGVAAEQQWKDKYRDLVREYERKEHEWVALERALRSAAGKLAFAAMGHGAALDKAVQAVVAELKTDLSTARLDASLSGLVRALQQPGPEPEPARAAAATPAPTPAPIPPQCLLRPDKRSTSQSCCAAYWSRSAGRRR